PIDPHSNGKGTLEVFQGRVQQPGQRQRVRPRLFLDAQDDSRFCIVGSFAALKGLADSDLRQIAYQDRSALSRRNYGLADLVLTGDSSYPLNQILLPAGDAETR